MLAMITGPLTWRSLRACKTLYPTRSWRRRRSRRIVVVSRPALNARARIRGLLLTTSSPHLPALPRHGPEARVRLTRVAAHALYASKRSSARCLNNPSAICERAEFWVHRDRTLVLATFLGLELECPANQPVFYRCMYQVQCCAGTELCSAPPLTLAHWRAGRPQRAMKPAAAASSK